MGKNELSLERRVSYDSSDAAFQWRGHMHIMTNPQGLLSASLIIFIVSVFLAHLSPLFIVAAALSTIVISLIQIWVVVCKRSTGQRICTTTISEEGLHDLTPDSDKRYTWNQIRKVEMSKGDLYFITITGGVFVPRSAFTDEGSVIDYYTHAFKLWQAGRKNKKRNLIGLPSSTDKAISKAIALGEARQKQEQQKQVEDLLAEDESVWTALEEEHKKRKGTDNVTKDEYE